MNRPETAAQRWQRILVAPDGEIDLAEAALAIAADEYRDLDIADYLGRLDDMSAALARRLRGDICKSESIIALNHFCFDELGFSGNAAEYYDPRNSFLNDVLERKLGIPITLSIVYIAIGRRIGLPLQGVSFPGHFLVKCAMREGAVVLDPYARGASLGLDDLLERLRAWRNGIDLEPDLGRNLLSPAGKREILVRMLRNLKGIYLDQRALEKALAVVNRILALAPQAAGEYRDRATLYMEMECFRAALADFRSYLSLNPGAPDAAAIGEKLDGLQRVAARLN